MFQKEHLHISKDSKKPIRVEHVPLRIFVQKYHDIELQLQYVRHLVTYILKKQNKDGKR